MLMLMMERHTVDDRRSLTVEICPEVEKVKITTFLTICLFLSYFFGSMLIAFDHDDHLQDIAALMPAALPVLASVLTVQVPDLI